MTENCHIVETGAGEGIILLTLRQVQWMKVCRSLDDAAHVATQLKIIGPNGGIMTKFKSVQDTRGYWCAVSPDYDVSVLLGAGFTFATATN
jgi:hypothetical protein